MKTIKVGTTVWAVGERIYTGTVEEADGRTVQVNRMWFGTDQVFASRSAAVLDVVKAKERAARQEYNRLSRAEETAQRSLARTTAKRQRAGAAWEKAKAAVVAAKGKA